MFELRIERGLSQAELARIAGEGFSQSLIARIESGKVNPPLSKVKRLLEVLYEEAGTGGITAGQVAVRPVTMARHSDPVALVIETMGKKAISQLPVQGIDGNLIGSITEKKLAELIVARGKGALRLPVSSIMDPPLPEIDASASLAETQDQLLNGPALIVKGGGKVVGILTKTDFLKYIGATSK